MLTYNFHKNFQLPYRATRIWNLVAPMKFLVAPGNRAAVNVKPWIGYRNETVWSRVGLDLPEKQSVYRWFSLDQGFLNGKWNSEVTS